MLPPRAVGGQTGGFPAQGDGQSQLSAPPPESPLLRWNGGWVRAVGPSRPSTAPTGRHGSPGRQSSGPTPRRPTPVVQPRGPHGSGRTQSRRRGTGGRAGAARPRGENPLLLPMAPKRARVQGSLATLPRSCAGRSLEAKPDHAPPSVVPCPLSGYGWRRVTPVQVLEVTATPQRPAARQREVWSPERAKSTRPRPSRRSRSPGPQANGAAAAPRSAPAPPERPK